MKNKATVKNIIKIYIQNILFKIRRGIFQAFINK